MKSECGPHIKQCLKQFWIKMLSCYQEDKTDKGKQKPITIGSPFDFRHEGGQGPPFSGLVSTNTTTSLLPRASAPAETPVKAQPGSVMYQSTLNRAEHGTHEPPSTTASSLNLAKPHTGSYGDKDGDSITTGASDLQDYDKSLDR